MGGRARARGDSTTASPAGTIRGEGFNKFSTIIFVQKGEFRFRDEGGGDRKRPAAAGDVFLSVPYQVVYKILSKLLFSQIIF